MTQELKACPFCGGEAEIDEIAGGIGALFFASCKDDDCCGYRIDPWVKHSRRIEAAQHWNTRTPDSVIAELVEAIKPALDYVCVQPIPCSGWRCREVWCPSCNGDENAENACKQIAEILDNARSALAKLEASK